jgi:hypothetical protein
MNIKKILRTVVVPVVVGAVAAGVAILLSRPTVSVTIDPDYDVPTDVDEPPFVMDSEPGVVKSTVRPARKSTKNV